MRISRSIATAATGCDFDVALRFIRHEARTHTIRAWTGLTDDRIRKLYRSYLADSPSGADARHRGKSPQRAAFFTALGASARAERAAGEPVSAARACCRRRHRAVGDALPSLRRAELLCQAYEVYRSVCPSRGADFVRARGVPAAALTRGDELVLRRLPRLQRASLVIDRWSLRSRPLHAVRARRVSETPRPRACAAGLPLPPPVCKTVAA